MIKLLSLELIYGAAGARDVFEDLCFDLIKSLFPDVEVRHIQRKKGDGGIDVYVGDLTDPNGIEVFQAKFFDREVGNSQRNQIRESFNHCTKNPEFKTKKWTLCLPRNLALDESKWFANWKQDAAVAANMPSRNIALWDANDLERILDQPDNQRFKDKYFSEQHLTQIREMHGMLIELTKEIYNYMGGPTQETVRMQLAKYLESNLNKATIIYNGTVYYAERFDLSQRGVIESQILTTFPSLYVKTVEIFQALEKGNRLIDVAEDYYRNPKWPNRDNVSAQDIYQPVVHTITQLKVHISQVITPMIEALLEDIKKS